VTVRVPEFNPERESSETFNSKPQAQVVGEFLDCLMILGAPPDDVCVLRGRAYLLDKDPRRSGMLVSTPRE
jgi:hypothetical protein